MAASDADPRSAAILAARNVLDVVLFMLSPTIRNPNGRAAQCSPAANTPLRCPSQPTRIQRISVDTCAQSLGNVRNALQLVRLPDYGLFLQLCLNVTKR